MLVHWCIGVLVYWCIGVLVHSAVAQQASEEAGQHHIPQAQQHKEFGGAFIDLFSSRCPFLCSSFLCEFGMRRRRPSSSFVPQAQHKELSGIDLVFSLFRVPFFCPAFLSIFLQFQKAEEEAKQMFIPQRAQAKELSGIDLLLRDGLLAFLLKISKFIPPIPTQVCQRHRVWPSSRKCPRSSPHSPIGYANVTGFGLRAESVQVLYQIEQVNATVASKLTPLLYLASSILCILLIYSFSLIPVFSFFLPPLCPHYAGCEAEERQLQREDPALGAGVRHCGQQAHRLPPSVPEAPLAQGRLRRALRLLGIPYARVHHPRLRTPGMR